MTETTVIENLDPEFISIADLINLIKIYGKKIDRAACARILISPSYELLDLQMILVMDKDTGKPLFGGFLGDEENHPYLMENICQAIRVAYIDAGSDTEEKNRCLNHCQTIGFSRKIMLGKISDQGADFYIQLPLTVLNHAQSFSGRLDKTVPLESVLRVHNETRREMLRLRRQPPPEPPRLHHSDTPRPLSRLEQAKSDIEHGQQLPEQVIAPPKKIDSRELTSYHKLISILLFECKIDTSQPHQAAELLDTIATTNKLPSMDRKTFVKIIEQAKLTRIKVT